jgi:hypothetical protein
MLIADRITAVVALVLGIGSLIEGYRVWDGWGGLGSLPVLIGTSLVCLAVALYITAQSSKGETIEWPARPVQRRLLLVCGMAFGYVSILPYLGYLLSTAVFMLGLTWTMGSTRPAVAISFGVLTSVISYATFKVGLHMPLPSGFFGF